ncbi:MAG: tRNA uridine-5-carboxymethylaminomethyl(34) synthesis GTPase MnmE [Candidatus Schekmanbacteria bacterium RBG_13_48_7]|uniref:tRNA modification GTPase MnmE n=1 Tax=Candidatus Schekmanbacteria bacterium RBG_13_48_7 TaxID=1817878 RepID=A0A1F7RQD5_9BACT|nr:MAG: tRNA uridine-5-carboxymethylaminomethyl(34) synthesis GTPase MnmE [Candidatus Schekmanbacteria bacterium RBG_13_48_7]
MNNDTIAALATAEGIGALAVIRLSGKDTLTIIKKIFHPVRSRKKFHFESWRAYYGTIAVKKDLRIDEEVIVTIYKAPYSYTCEDMAEISCHGGKISSRKILKCLFEQGARLAEKGEFTKRALLNARIDLIKAEAIDKLIHATNEKEYERALLAARKEHETAVLKIKNTLHQILEEVEVSIEYPEDYEIKEIHIKNQISLLIENLKMIIETNEEEEQSGGIKIVIFGEKNAGKSTIFNQLTGKDRSIITEIPGTTRDVIEIELERNNELYTISDTAGYGDIGNEIDKIAVNRAEKVLKQANIILFVFEGTGTWGEEETRWIEQTDKNQQLIIIMNKKDLKKFKSLKKTCFCDVAKIDICAHEKGDIDKLWKLIEKVKKKMKHETSGENEIFLINQRQIGLIKAVEQKLEDASILIEKKCFIELVAFELHQARKKLGEWFGEDTPHEILNDIFNSFCVGK